MSTAEHTFKGSCHCGGIRATFISTKPAAELQVRACQCGFCTRHATLTVSDPAGRLVFEARPSALAGYEFGMRTGTSLLCRTCGTYVGFALKDGEGMWAIANARGLGMAEFLDRQPEAMAYDAETAEQRIARRKTRWTPAEVREVRE